MVTDQLSPRAARAHALKNCLNVVSAVNRLLELEMSDRARGRISRSQEAIQRMVELIDDDLAPVSRVRRPRPRAWVPAAEVARAVVARVSDRAEAGHVEVFVRCGSGGVLGDAGELAEALTNFVLNAIQATPSGGGVFVATYECVDGSQLWTVQDTGPGLPREMVDRIGTAYCSSQEGGTGLGVALSREIIEQHGGHARIESWTGAGTLVTIELPAAERESGPESIGAVE